MNIKKSVKDIKNGLQEEYTRENYDAREDLEKSVVGKWVLDHQVFSVFFATLLLSLLFTASGIWQLAFIPGIFAGYFHHKRARDSFFMGFVCVLFAWGIFILYYISNEGAYELMDMIFAFIIGSEGFGFLAIILSLLVGGLLGGLGAVVGYSLYEIFGSKNSTIKDNEKEKGPKLEQNNQTDS